VTIAPHRRPAGRLGRELPRAGISTHPQRRALAWINVIGGVAVLGSYAWGFAAHPETVGALWGGVPETLRPLYTVNMFLAAGGYLLFTHFVLVRLEPVETRIAARPAYGLFPLLYLLVLVPSALWMPLTILLLEAPSAPLWWLIRLDLALVGAGSMGLLLAILALRAPGRPRGRAAAIAGLVPFILQTAVLDALVWPACFPAPIGS
jgi:hypothetical protein